MKNIDSTGHVTGKSLYLDDLPLRQDTLFGVVVDSEIAHGHILSFDASEAKNYPGVVRILTAKDIPGENQIGGIIADEGLFAEDSVHFIGQPIALILATSERAAREARQKVKIEYKKLRAITEPREAAAKGEYLLPPKTFASGNPEKQWDKCEYIFTGSTEQAGQEHLYLETQGAYSYPLETENLMVHSSTQSPTAAQRTIAKVLGLPMHRIQVDVVRLGGGFGGKEDQATAWAVMSSLGAYLLNKPVKVVLSRHDDLRMTGKRHPYSSDFKIGFSKDLKILAYEVEYFQNGGAANDLSPAITERTLFHTTNAYYIPHVKATVHSCKTNLPPNTAFRGFGGPQGMFVIESAIAQAAMELGVPSSVIQEKNFIKENDVFYYGQVAKNVNVQKVWNAAHKEYGFTKKQKAIEQFNQKNTLHKKGWAFMPIAFGISFTNTSMNQARALVHIYSDGSVGVSTGAIEMGQGVNTKMLQVAEQTFGISPDRIKLESTNTTRVSNTSPTAASSGADLNGKALQVACTAILRRLKSLASDLFKVPASKIQIKDELVFANGKKTGWNWEKLVYEAFMQRINLTESGHYATPIIHFDKEAGKGHPFAYHVYGLAFYEVTVDVIRGTYEIDEVDVIHDFGKSMNPIIDLGQVEGALVQGIGYTTMEELAYDNEGRLLSNSLSTYKVPDIYAVPAVIRVKPLKTGGHSLAIFKSKAVGEPPLMYGLGAYFAIQNAVRAFNSDFRKFDAPITPEKVLMGLYQKKEKTVQPSPKTAKANASK
ncbi:MAG: molybdopterin-dependent oxidoreductase [Bacteroidales bacterium]|nr:molybdopterin-dependent oxidoreductase [Bacteroidales bacterium]